MSFDFCLHVLTHISFRDNSREWGPREDNGEPREPRRPKRKVAVMIGYCGTGYHGMQINPPHKTIEEDLYKAFVEAGAISKDNASDLRKSSFMRAARTDKGVHAAGNVVSLKLIIEDPDVVEKINSHLPDQIRVWGISRTNKAFECRKMCSSRIYEYLIPSYSFLPPKPESALAKSLAEADKQYPGVKRNDPEGIKFWEDVKQELLASGITEEDINRVQKVSEDAEHKQLEQTRQKILESREKAKKELEERLKAKEETPEQPKEGDEEQKTEKAKETSESKEMESEETETKVAEESKEAESQEAEDPKEESENKEEDATDNSNKSELKFSEIVKKIKTVEREARRNYRISKERLDLIRQVLKQYEGVHNFHNFTIQKTFRDPSAQRNMKTLSVSEPKIIENTEWLSIKIHGQSFMMHQIRKMIAMATLIVRCGTPITRIQDAFGNRSFNIPKAPGLGLLLEQPVYDAYNSRLDALGYEPINFEKCKDEVEAFKFKHIYDKIYGEEDREHVFYKFFSFIDSFKGDATFEYLAPGPEDVGSSQISTATKVAVGAAATAGAAAAVSAFVMADDEEDDELPVDGDTEG